MRSTEVFRMPDFNAISCTLHTHFCACFLTSVYETAVYLQAFYKKRSLFYKRFKRYSSSASIIGPDPLFYSYFSSISS